MKFIRISNPHFPEVPQSVVDDLSSDQHYAYRMCMAVILGSVESNLQFLEVGLVYSRWLTLASRLLRYYVSLEKTSANKSNIVEFCIMVNFPTWFEIKLKNKLIHGSQNFFNLVQRITKLSNKKIRETAFKVVQWNPFFAHPENVY